MIVLDPTINVLFREIYGHIQKYQKLFSKIVKILPYCLLMSLLHDSPGKNGKISQIFHQMINL